MNITAPTARRSICAPNPPPRKRAEKERLLRMLDGKREKN